MMYRKNKGGISLIVLVITIIVMIILATAIILSLSNTGIISKANKAKEDTDFASAKEVVNMAKVNWDLMSEGERKDYTDFVKYAEDKLEEAGFDKTKYTVSENGTVELKNGASISYKEIANDCYTLEPITPGASDSKLKITIDVSKITDEYIKIPDKGVFELLGNDKLPITTVILSGENQTVKQVEFPNNMTKLDFNNNLVKLEKLVLPDSCIEGETVKYSNCTSLTSITCNGTYISLLYGAIPSLEELTVTGGKLTGTDLLNSSGKPSNIYLNNKVTSVGFSAFPNMNCTIHYDGTETEFTKIYQKSGGAHSAWNSTTIVEFSDGKTKSIIELDS